MSNIFAANTVLDVVCPTCAAEIGQHCVTKAGAKATATHKPRELALQATIAEPEATEPEAAEPEAAEPEATEAEDLIGTPAPEPKAKKAKKAEASTEAAPADEPTAEQGSAQPTKRQRRRPVANTLEEGQEPTLEALLPECTHTHTSEAAVARCAHRREVAARKALAELTGAPQRATAKTRRADEAAEAIMALPELSVFGDRGAVTDAVRAIILQAVRGK